MKLHINVRNHADVICAKKGRFAGWFLNLPVARIFSHSKVDKEIRTRIATSIHNTLPSTIKEELQKNGIDADVSVEFR